MGKTSALKHAERVAQNNAANGVDRRSIAGKDALHAVGRRFLCIQAVVGVVGCPC